MAKVFVLNPSSRAGNMIERPIYARTLAGTNEVRRSQYLDTLPVPGFTLMK